MSETVIMAEDGGEPEDRWSKDEVRRRDAVIFTIQLLSGAGDLEGFDNLAKNLIVSIEEFLRTGRMSPPVEAKRTHLKPV